MIPAVIRMAIGHRGLVLIATAFLAAAAVIAVLHTPVDALPDVGDTQVVVRTTYPGKPPQVVEDLVTYPMTTTLLSVPGAKTVRGYSFFGDSFVYVLFDDKTDPYWARSRVVESLNQLQGRLPAGASAVLGPDATGVGWVYEYALVDRTGKKDIGQLRALNDWFLKFELKTVPDVAEVASIGGMVRQYQVVLDPDRMRAAGIALPRVVEALKQANQSSGGSVVEMAETEYMVRSDGFLRSLEDLRGIPLGLDGATPLTLRDVATVQIGPEMRRGIAELDGEGEVTGGVVVMRSGKNARTTIAAVKSTLERLKASLPPGVEIVETYDRSRLIDDAIGHLQVKLLEEFIAVALVCALFLLHLRSALVAVVVLPVAVGAAFLVMRWQGLNANILSLAGIALALGAALDGVVVMLEAVHKRIEASGHGAQPLPPARRWALVTEACIEVGPALFFSLLVITLSFLPVFTLEAQEGRLFAPLAFTKTYTMAAAAVLSVTLVPVLMGYLVRGRIPRESVNPLNRLLMAAYRPALELVLRFPCATLAAAALVLALTVVPLTRLGGEFMPPLDEGDLLYMPSALPGLSVAKASQLLQQTDRLIKTVPEVARVFGKAGRADTATDPAPLEMFETTIQFKPRSQWRPGMTPDKLVDALDRAVQVPGLTNVWVPPIRNRIDMLATGIKSPVGIKISGTDLRTIDRLTTQVETAVKRVPGVSSALAERLTGGRYIDVDVDRAAAARHGMSVADVQLIVSTAIGGENVGEVISGRERFPLNLRYPRDVRDSLERLRTLPFMTATGAQLLLQDVARIRIEEGPPMLRSENARLSGWVYVDVRGRDLRSVVREMQAAVAREVPMPAGHAVSWSGQFEYLERATERMKVVVPATLAVIFTLLYLLFRKVTNAALVMAAVPFSLVGGCWLVWLLGHAVSVATAVGFIALAGVAAEFGVVMLVYLEQALARRLAAGEADSHDTLLAAIREGAVLRVRPKAMTVAIVLAGLVPMLWGQGTGHEVMARIAAPMIGGMITAPLLSMLVMPAAWYLIHRRRLGAVRPPDERQGRMHTPHQSNGPLHRA
ncbi:efflux RND transporter permease subunit [Roseateles sp. MS654]|uniref:efflux RND transporter permease subunit n=1 Tax=Roseateles sp. MS654 TaxID=3412685 RepID=UPI003C2BD78F